MKRVDSLDVLRGLIIVIMALDHVRDFWGAETFQAEDLTQTYPTYFFTRIVTHLCAPIFIFLAGASAFLYEQKVKDKMELSKFLLSRGIWLVFIEIMLVNPSWNLAYFWSSGWLFLQVIWAIGISMIVLAGLIWLGKKTVLVISLLLIFGHNALNFITPEDFGSLSWVWTFLHESGFFTVGGENGFGIFVAYPLIPWIGVMGAGYCFGQVMLWEPAERIKWLVRGGLGLILIFIGLRGTNWYGDTADWTVQKDGLFTLMSFLNTQKYPPSLLYLCMTLGPGLLLLALFEKWTRFNAFFKTFGRVPFFFYVLHFPFIHLTSIFYHRIRYGEWFDMVNLSSEQWPAFYQPSLWLVYVAWIGTVAVFYFLCRWYNQYKFNHNYWWLKYI